MHLPLYTRISSGRKTGSVCSEDATTDHTKSHSLDGQQIMITGTLWKSFSIGQQQSLYLSIGVNGLYWGQLNCMKLQWIWLHVIWLLKKTIRPRHSFSKHTLCSYASSVVLLFWRASYVHEYIPVGQTKVHPCPVPCLWAIGRRFLEDKNKKQDKSEIPVHTVSASSNQLLRGLSELELDTVPSC